MGDLLGYQVAPYTWSWTGRFAQFLPLQTTRSIMCAFNPAKGVQGVRGFWLRSASLCSLTIVLDPATAACTMSVYMKGQLHWQCTLGAATAQCSLLSPEDTQQGWVLAAAAADTASKCCFLFEDDAQICAEVLQHVRAQQAAYSRQHQRPEPAAPAQTFPAADTSSRHPVAEWAGGTAQRPDAVTQRSAPGTVGLPQPAGRQADAAAGQPPQQQSLDALAQMSDAILASEVQRCMANPAFRSLVDRVESLWDELGLPAS